MGEVGALGRITPYPVQLAPATQGSLEAVPKTARHEAVDDWVHRAGTKGPAYHRADVNNQYT